VESACGIGVCADFYGQMREVAAEWFERPVDELTPDVTYRLRESVGRSECALSCAILGRTLSSRDNTALDPKPQWRARAITS
jgi:hypothetical protein